MADRQNKYAYLDQLSTEQLEELLRADVYSGDAGAEELIFHILEVIEKREQESPTGRLADANAAWEEFQKYYNIPEGNGQSLYPCETDQNNIGHDLHPSEKANGSAKRPRPHRIWRGGLVAVAAMAALHDDEKDVVSVDFVGSDKFYTVGVTYYHSTVPSLGTFEKDDDSVEEYLSNGKLFYIFSNIDTVTATWYHNQYMIMIGGNLTKTDLTMIIDSIGGN